MSELRSAELVEVELQPIGRRVRLPAGSTLLEAAQLAGVDLTATCGGFGTCGSCKVRVMHGRVSEVTAAEVEALGHHQLSDGLRLACRTSVLDNSKIYIPAESLFSRQRLQLEGADLINKLEPAITIHEVIAEDQPVIEIRNDDGIVAVLPNQSQVLGLAVDLGSTKIAAYLLDLQNGAVLASTGRVNPQTAFGEDVVSRIAYANRGETQRQQLQQVLIETINQAAEELCHQADASPDQICDCVVVGNTVMHHLLCGLPVSSLGSTPYSPVSTESLAIPASQLGLNFAAGALIYLPPIIAGYVGADHVAALQSTFISTDTHTRILIDIGTNTEISLAHNGQIYCCSCASGPAFEGAHIHDGMRALPGAIERVEVQEDGRTVIQTIDALPPVGLCGSGILSAIAELRKAGIIDQRGAVRWQGKKDFPLVEAKDSAHGREILISRSDVHEIQLAKGAIRAGIEVLLNKASITPASVDEWIVAGAFGTYLNLQDAIRIGMFPSQPLVRFTQVGNAAGAGARQMLRSADERKKAEALISSVHYVELTNEPGFQEIYIQALYFPD